MTAHHRPDDPEDLLNELARSTHDLADDATDFDAHLIRRQPVTDRAWTIAAKALHAALLASRVDHARAATANTTRANEDKIAHTRQVTALIGTALKHLTAEEAQQPTSDHPTLAAVLRSFYTEDEPQAGVVGALGEFLDATALSPAVQPDNDDFDDGVGCLLQEASGFVVDDAGSLIDRATATLDPHGQRTP
jgi:hypothetical protein